MVSQSKEYWLERMIIDHLELFDTKKSQLTSILKQNKQKLLTVLMALAGGITCYKVYQLIQPSSTSSSTSSSSEKKKKQVSISALINEKTSSYVSLASNNSSSSSSGSGQNKSESGDSSSQKSRTKLDGSFLSRMWYLLRIAVPGIATKEFLSMCGLTVLVICQSLVTNLSNSISGDLMSHLVARGVSKYVQSIVYLTLVLSMNSFITPAINYLMVCFVVLCVVLHVLCIECFV